jgi:hypothetical protein
MHYAEVQAWSQRATRQEVCDVCTEGALARIEWRRRIHRQDELHDLAPFTGGPVYAADIASVAFGAAVELAVLVKLWRRPS